MRAGHKSWVLLASAALVLGGCDRSDPSICGILTDFNPLGKSGIKDPVALYENAQGCVEHWGARLSHSRQDAAKDVAEAAAEMCKTHIDQWAAIADGNRAYANADEIAQFERKALAIVIQARSGNCYAGV